MPFLSSPMIYIIAFLLATNIVSGIGWKLSAANADSEKQKVVQCQATHEAFVAQVKAQGQIAAEQAKSKEAEYDRIAEETAHGWASAVAAVRADAASRVRNAARRSAGSREMPGISSDQQGNAQAGADPIPAAERVAADCAETTVTANYLQAFIERIEFISNKTGVSNE